MSFRRPVVIAIFTATLVAAPGAQQDATPVLSTPPAIGERSPRTARNSSRLPATPSRSSSTNSYDIYSQAGRIIKAPKGPLGALTGRVRFLLADGESQSANRLVTYVNAVHLVAQVYDGFFIHSRVGTSGTPLAQDPKNQQL